MSNSEQTLTLQEGKKRRIGDIAPALEPDYIIRFPGLWFDDGNIILQAEKTQFRIHRGHISAHSSMFKDMFMIPQPEGEELVEGCPVIHVPDRAEDWANLLMTMYHAFQIHRLPKDYPVSRVLSLLRLGHKYHFDHFRDIGAERLKSAFPLTLDEWDECPMHIPDINDEDDIEERYTKDFEFDLVNTALEVGLHSILPLLYFVCLRDRTMTEIMEGFRRKDGTISTLPAHVQSALVCSRDYIVGEAINRTILGPLQDVESAREDGTIKCLSETRTCKLRSEKADNRQFLLATHPGAALQPPEYLCDCAPCNSQVFKSMITGRDSIWKSLPEHFGLPAWGKTKDFDM